MKNYCVFGGQYGSEGKGCVVEWLCKQSNTKFNAVSANGPNSGHTTTIGKLRQLPAASFFCDNVYLGPASAICLDILKEDIQTLRNIRGSIPNIFIHENAAIVDDECRECEHPNIASISSTGSGTGWAIHRKEFYRNKQWIVRHLTIPDATILHNNDWKIPEPILFECSQGVLLDVNLGIYPFVTARTTIPKAMIAINGMGNFAFDYYGVYRTLPIRTGGPSGPCCGKELSWEELGITPEIATVTKRIRRVFAWDWNEWNYSRSIAHPDVIFLTHLDYLDAIEGANLLSSIGSCWFSNNPSNFNFHQG